MSYKRPRVWAAGGSNMVPLSREDGALDFADTEMVRLYPSHLMILTLRPGAGYSRCRGAESWLP
jgi:hypothetical protein